MLHQEEDCRRGWSGGGKERGGGLVAAGVVGGCTALLLFRFVSLVLRRPRRRGGWIDELAHV